MKLCPYIGIAEFAQVFNLQFPPVDLTAGGISDLRIYYDVRAIKLTSTVHLSSVITAVESQIEQQSTWSLFDNGH